MAGLSNLRQSMTACLGKSTLLSKVHLHCQRNVRKWLFHPLMTAGQKRQSECVTHGWSFDEKILQDRRETVILEFAIRAVPIREPIIWGCPQKETTYHTHPPITSLGGPESKIDNSLLAELHFYAKILCRVISAKPGANSEYPRLHLGEGCHRCSEQAELGARHLNAGT